MLGDDIYVDYEEVTRKLVLDVFFRAEDGLEKPSYAFFFVSDAFRHWHQTSLGLRISISLLALDVFPSASHEV